MTASSLHGLGSNLARVIVVSDSWRRVASKAHLLTFFDLFVLLVLCSFFFFFFSSRRRHTRSKRDWSSDVCSSDLTFCKAAGMAEAAGPVLPGTAGAPSVPAASKSAAILAIWRASFMALFLFLHRHCRRGRQTLFGNDFHGVLDGDMYDAAGSIDPLQLFIGLGVVADLFAQIGLRIGFLARKLTRRPN